MGETVVCVSGTTILPMISAGRRSGRGGPRRPGGPSALSRKRPPEQGARAGRVGGIQEGDHDGTEGPAGRRSGPGGWLRAGGAAPAGALGGDGRGAAATVSGRRPHPRGSARRHDGRDDRRPAVRGVAVAGADGCRSRRLVQLGPPRQLRTPQRRAHPPRVAGDRRRRPPDCHARRQRVVGGGGAGAGALPVPAHVARPARSPVRPGGTPAALLHRLDLGVPPGRAARRPEPARRQRLLVASAAVAAAARERHRPGALALDHADAPVQEPQAARRAGPGNRGEHAGAAQTARVATQSSSAGQRTAQSGDTIS